MKHMVSITKSWNNWESSKQLVKMEARKKVLHIWNPKSNKSKTRMLKWHDLDSRIFLFKEDLRKWGMTFSYFLFTFFCFFNFWIFFFFFWWPEKYLLLILSFAEVYLTLPNNNHKIQVLCHLPTFETSHTFSVRY